MEARLFPFASALEEITEKGAHQVIYSFEKSSLNAHVEVLDGEGNPIPVDPVVKEGLISGAYQALALRGWEPGLEVEGTLVLNLEEGVFTPEVTLSYTRSFYNVPVAVSKEFPLEKLPPQVRESVENLVSQGGEPKEFRLKYSFGNVEILCEDPALRNSLEDSALRDFLVEALFGNPQSGSPGLIKETVEANAQKRAWDLPLLSVSELDSEELPVGSGTFTVRILPREGVLSANGEARCSFQEERGVRVEGDSLSLRDLFHPEATREVGGLG